MQNRVLFSKSLLIVLVLTTKVIQAQDRRPEFLGEKNNPTDYFTGYILKRKGELLEKANHLDTLCLESICYVKFKIDATGKIFNIDCTVTAPKLISNFLKEMVKSSDSLWTPQLREGKPVESVSFLLPVYYRIYSKCKDRNKPDMKAIEGFWHIHWFGPAPPYDSSLKGVSYQTEVIEQYFVLHPVLVQIGQPRLIP